MIFWLNVDIRHFRGKFALPADMTRPTFFAAKPQQLPPHLYFAAHPPSIYSPHQQPMNIEYYGYAIPTPSPTRTPSIGSSTPIPADPVLPNNNRIIVVVSSSSSWYGALYSIAPTHRSSTILIVSCHRWFNSEIVTTSLSYRHHCRCNNHRVSS